MSGFASKCVPVRLRCKFNFLSNHRLLSKAHFVSKTGFSKKIYPDASVPMPTKVHVIRNTFLVSGFQASPCPRRLLSSSVGPAEILNKGSNNEVAPTLTGQEATSTFAEDLIHNLDPVPSGWSPAALAEFGIVAIHDAFGLPWFLSIAGITVALRTLLFPLTIYQMKNIARLALIKDDMEAITKRWKALGGYSAPPQASDAYQKQLSSLFEKNNCNPMRSMIGIFVQAPLFISFFFALRHMSLTYPSFKTGGALWFTDLSVTDPMYLLPVASALTMLASIELGAETGQAMSEQKASMKLFFRGFACFMVPSLIIAGIPNGVFMYWLSANTFSLAQVLLLRIPGVKEALGIPKMQPAPPPPTSESLMPRVPAVVFSVRPPSGPKADPSRTLDVESSSEALPGKQAATKGVRVKRRR